MVKDLIPLWEEAADIDPTLRTNTKSILRLRHKYVGRPIAYSRPKLFSRMAKRQISLFHNCPVSISCSCSSDIRKHLAQHLRTGFPAEKRPRIQVGPSRQRARAEIPELIRRWEGGRAVVSVTDLHFRDTKFQRAIDTSVLSDFNILATDRDLVERLEMLTLVVSSARNLTDNHTDDCDGSNHCFVGKKLWLAWDRSEGEANGFGDADRDYVTDQAAFDIDTFISMRSSRWFLVTANQTLFLPGSLSHKVITLEPYLGVGSFHVALPSYIFSLRRWLLHDACDAAPLLDKINQLVIRKVRQLRNAPPALQRRWGLSYMQHSIAEWIKHESSQHRKALVANPFVASFLEVAKN